MVGGAGRSGRRQRAAAMVADDVNENLLVYLFCRLINTDYLAFKSPDYVDPGVIEVDLYDSGAPAGDSAESGEIVT